MRTLSLNQGVSSKLNTLASLWPGPLVPDACLATTLGVPRLRLGYNSLPKYTLSAKPVDLPSRRTYTHTTWLPTYVHWLRACLLDVWREH
jgi:hypothetical protein